MPFTSLLRTLTIAAALLPAVADARPAYITEPIRLHAGPGPDYPQIAVLPPGMEIDVVGCLQGYQWCDLVTPDGFRGWAWSGALSFSWAGEPLPIIQYGPSFGIPLISFIIGDYWGHHYRDRPWYDDRHNWRHAPPPALYRAPPPRMEPRPWPAPGWNPGWNPGRDHEREHRWQDDRRRDDHRDDYRNSPPRQERERAPRQEPPPPISPPRAAPQPNPGGWGQQNAPRQEAPRMEPPRPPGEPNSRFRPPPEMDNQRDNHRGHGGEGGRSQENRFGGRQ